MSTLQRSGRIADPVHGYVDFTPVERAVLDHPVAQRLRYISQNGLAHLVFPEARTSRFSHSLGAMHLASEFLKASLRNADPDVRKEVCQGVRSAIREVSAPDVAMIGNGLPHDMLEAHHYVEPEFQPFLIVCEQALRLAALFHDLGHLPFSHDFEYALDDYWHNLPREDQEASPLAPLLQQRVGRTQIHERLGHELSRLLFEELFHDLTPAPLQQAVLRSLSLAHQILEAGYVGRGTPAESALNWLHALVDGELDCDRSDYLLRDALHHGFDFASYDLGRLLDNFTVGIDDSGLVVAIRPQGMSSVESFMLARFRSNKYGIRQHKVVQIGLALRLVIAEMIATGPSNVPQFLEDIGAVGAEAIGEPDRESLLARFAAYDEVWWTSQMRDLSSTDPSVGEWLDLVCWRKPGPRSLWKRRAEFPDAANLADWNKELPTPSDLVGRRRWFEELTKLRREGVLVLRHDFTPWRRTDGGDSVLPVRQPNGELVPINQLSSLVDGLHDAWMKEVQVQAFRSSVSSVTAKEVYKRLSGLADVVK